MNWSCCNFGTKLQFILQFLYEISLAYFKMKIRNLSYLCNLSELQMMVGIIPEEYQKGTFEKISRGSLNMVVQESEAIIEKVKKVKYNINWKLCGLIKDNLSI